MQRVVITCDHCGKQLNLMQDFDHIDIIVNSPIPSNTADLCKDCYHLLINEIERFIHNKRDPKEQPKDSPTYPLELCQSTTSSKDLGITTAMN